MIEEKNGKSIPDATKTKKGKEALHDWMGLSSDWQQQAFHAWMEASKKQCEPAQVPETQT
jgi:hypothetical protein